MEFCSFSIFDPDISAGLLRAHYIAGGPGYLNYGAFGQSVGHEIVHGFDQVGHQIDLNGDLAEWPNEIESEFNSKVACYIRQVLIMTSFNFNYLL